jgi:hypothetical protein
VKLVAQFPSLNPQLRSFTPAQYPNTHIGTLDGDELSVRHTNSSTGSILRLTFNGIDQNVKLNLIAHYSFHARFVSFDLSSTTLLGSGITIPANYQWIYVAPPAFTETPGVITASVELEMIPPYTL